MAVGRVWVDVLTPKQVLFFNPVVDLVKKKGLAVLATSRHYREVEPLAKMHGFDLTYVGEEWTRGNYPRSFTFDPSGQFLYCCNQRGDNIAVFRVDRKSGSLSFTGHYVPVGNPSSIVFLDRKKGE